jgi:hypothetical protein
MTDLIFIAASAGFFGMCILYGRMCGELMKNG